MKLEKRLTVAGVEYPIVSDSVRLNIDRPGVAILQVISDTPLSGRVEFFLGWSGQGPLIRIFTGEVGTSTTVDKKQQRLYCRELSARLDNAAPIALRHPTMRDVLGEYGRMLGLSFLVPDKPYAVTRVPAFYGLGSALHGLQSLGAVFHIDDYVWLTQGDGRVFAGSWADSRWQGKELQIPWAVCKQQSADGERSMAAIPALRPGAVVNRHDGGGRVEYVQFSGMDMVFKCQPF